MEVKWRKKVNDEEIVADRELMADNFQDANNMINKEVTNGDFMIECNHETGTEPSRETQGLNQVVEVDSIGPDETRSKELSGQKAKNMEDCMFLGLNREIEAHLEEADLMYPQALNRRYQRVHNHNLMKPYILHNLKRLFLRPLYTHHKTHRS